MIFSLVKILCFRAKAHLVFKGRTIRKVMGEVEKKTKKIHAGENAKKKSSCKEEGKEKKIHGRENAKKKNSCKEEGKEKKFMQKEGPTPGPAILISIINKYI